MITKFKIFETKSLDGESLIKELKPHFKNVYAVSMHPSGQYLNELDVSFKFPDRYNEEIREIINKHGWYPSSINGRAFTESKLQNKLTDNYTIIFKQIEGDNVSDKIPKVLYHLSPTINDYSIKTKGLIFKSEKKRDAYPDRIYLSSNDFILKKISKELSWYNNEKMYSLWKINTSKCIIDKLFIDDATPNSYYIQSGTIPAEALEKIDEFKV